MFNKKKINRTALSLFLTLLLSSPSAYAGREFETSDPLPDIENIVFSETALGFIPLPPPSHDQRHFILERVSGTFREIEAESFFKIFPPNQISPASEEKKDQETGHFTLLHASNGISLKTKSGYCGEGLSIPHQLWSKGEPFPAQVKPCNSIGTFEVVEKNIWLGTYYEGEGGISPGQGIVIHKQDESFLHKIDQEAGLTSNLIRVIRKDPFEDDIWVVTHLGINKISSDFQILDSQFFYEDFDSTTGVPTIYLSTKPKNDNPFAIVSRELKIENPLTYYQAVQQIPPEIRKRFSLYMFYMYSSSISDSPFMPKNTTKRNHLEPSFAPKEVNPLMPFFIRSTYSNNSRTRYLALSNLCMFNDKKLVNFLLDEKRNSDFNKNERKYIQDCLHKYVKAGLLTRLQMKYRNKFLLDQIKTSFENIKTQPANRPVPHQMKQDLDGLILSLKKMGSDKGFALFNDYFIHAENGLRDVSLLESLLSSELVYQDEIAKGVLAGMNRIRKIGVYRGCMYFNVSYRKEHPLRYHPKHAEAILHVLEEGMQSSNWQQDPRVKTCFQAFISQIKNTRLKDEFITMVYPKLTTKQQKISKQLLQLPFLTFEEIVQGKDVSHPSESP